MWGLAESAEHRTGHAAWVIPCWATHEWTMKAQCLFIATLTLKQQTVEEKRRYPECNVSQRSMAPMRGGSQTKRKPRGCRRHRGWTWHLREKLASHTAPLLPLRDTDSSAAVVRTRRLLVTFPSDVAEKLTLIQLVSYVRMWDVSDINICTEGIGVILSSIWPHLDPFCNSYQRCCVRVQLQANYQTWISDVRLSTYCTIRCRHTNSLHQRGRS